MAKHVGAVTEIVGTRGTDNIATFVNEFDANDVQVPFPAVTVYGVPKVIPEINPAPSTEGPIGSNT